LNDLIVFGHGFTGLAVTGLLWLKLSIESILL